jgi:hypothetical protein
MIKRSDFRRHLNASYSAWRSWFRAGPRLGLQSKTCAFTSGPLTRYRPTSVVIQLVGHSCPEIYSRSRLTKLKLNSWYRVVSPSAVSTWMSDHLGNTAAAEPVDGVSPMAPHSERALTCSRQKILWCHHTHSTFTTHARPGLDVKRHPHRVLALMK